ncbi:hypothetical protein, partial [Bartonella grahamii]|uniref:hypothetical protein n=1 Tax=Bartonella grahamii TaxID=33045 RepID=UPI001558FB99
ERLAQEAKRIAEDTKGAADRVTTAVTESSQRVTQVQGTVETALTEAREAKATAGDAKHFRTNQERF